MKSTESFDDLIQGLRNLPRAEAPPFLFTRILSRIESATGRVRTMPAYQLAFITTGLALLIALNVRLVYGVKEVPQTSTENTATQQSDFALDDHRFELY